MLLTSFFFSLLLSLVALICVYRLYGRRLNIFSHSGHYTCQSELIFSAFSGIFSTMFKLHLHFDSCTLICNIHSYCKTKIFNFMFFYIKRSRKIIVSWFCGSLTLLSRSTRLSIFQLSLIMNFIVGLCAYCSMPVIKVTDYQID